MQLSQKEQLMQTMQSLRPHLTKGSIILLIINIILSAISVYLLDAKLVGGMVYFACLFSLFTASRNRREARLTANLAYMLKLVSNDDLKEFRGKLFSYSLSELIILFVSSVALCVLTFADMNLVCMGSLAVLICTFNLQISRESNALDLIEIGE